MPSAPRGYLPIVGLAPDGSGEANFVVARDAILADFRETRNRSKHLEGFLVPEVLLHPSAIWVALKSPGKDDWLVYVGLPSARFLDDTSIEIPCPPGRVFAVYVRGVRARDGQRVVDSWEWIEADADRRDLPVGHATRYGSRLWIRD